MNPHLLPLINACLNGVSAILLVVGLVLIRGGRREAHRACMLSAFGVSCVFLVLYLFHKIVVVKGVNTPFPGPAALKPYYLAMLASHVKRRVLRQIRQRAVHDARRTDRQRIVRAWPRRHRFWG